VTHWPDGPQECPGGEAQTARSASELSEMDIEKPPDDAFEQEQDVVDTDDTDDPLPQLAEIPLDANEADAVEQHETVEVDDDDDYR
jgi:hypothetical protein